MSFRRNSIAAAALLALTLGGSMPLAARLVVKKGTGGAEKRYKPKSVLRDGAVIRLNRGERLELLHNGKSLTFTGPVTGAVGKLTAQQTIGKPTNKPAVTRGFTLRRPTSESEEMQAKAPQSPEGDEPQAADALVEVPSDDPEA